MDSLEKMRSLNGTVGTEKMIYCQFDNTLYEDLDYFYFLYSGQSDRLIKKALKSIIEIEVNWVWKLESSRFDPSGYTLVRTNVKYYRLDNGLELE